MSKIESITVGLVAGVLCPLLLFVLFWWSSAVLATARILRVSDGGIATAALTGLALGLVLDGVCLKRWTARFYSANMKLGVAVYLCCSVVAEAFFMGLPLGNLLLGTLAGVYVGRREYHAGAQGSSIAQAARRVAVFTALVTGVEASLIGVLALGERSVVRILQVGFGMEQATIAGPLGVGLVMLGGVALMAVQFWCTRTAVVLAFGTRRREASPAARRQEKRAPT